MSWTNAMDHVLFWKMPSKDTPRHYASVFHSAATAMAIVTHPQGTVAEANARFLHMCGGTRAEIVGRDIVETGLWRDAAEWGAFAAGITSTGPSSSAELETRRTRVHVLVSASLLEANGARSILITCTDVTALKERERKLAESEERFRRIAEIAPDIIFFLSLETGTYQYINPACEKYHGYTAEDFYKNPWLIHKLLHPKWRDYFEREYAKMMAGECSPTYEYQVVSKSGEERWLSQRNVVISNDAGVPVAFEGIVSDVTEYHRAEQALRTSEAHLRRAQDVAGLGVYRVDLAKRSYEMSEQARRIFPLSAGAELSYPQLLDIVHPEDRALVANAFDAALDGTGYDMEYRIQACGQTKWVHDRAELEPGCDGESKMAVGVLQDITERKHLETQLIQSQKMEAVGRLAGGIAHDLNNLLAIISGYSEMAIAAVRQGKDNTAELRHILDTVARGSAFVRQVLSLSRKIEPQRKPMNVNDEVRRVHEIWRRTLPKLVSVDVRLDPMLPTISGDANQIGLALLNLANNAVYAMPDGGRLTLYTEAVTCVDHPCSCCEERFDGAMVRISIKDTGCGMDADTRRRIFEPFYTTRDAGVGTGLGLPIVADVVHGHGGHIECLSALNEGTTFGIYLPVTASEELPPPAALKTGNKGTASCRATILFVDDEEEMADLFSYFLETAGYRVLTASDGRKALDMYNAGAGEIDAVVTDLNMPEMGGVRCLKEILAVNPRARVIVVSGHPDSANVREALAAGACAFLAKPYQSDELIEAVRVALAYNRVGG